MSEKELVKEIKITPSMMNAARAPQHDPKIEQLTANLASLAVAMVELQRSVGQIQGGMDQHSQIINQVCAMVGELRKNAAPMGQAASNMRLVEGEKESCEKGEGCCKNGSQGICEETGPQAA